MTSQIAKVAGSAPAEQNALPTLNETEFYDFTPLLRKNEITSAFGNLSEFTLHCRRESAKN